MTRDQAGRGVVFAFFGIPGAGKSTLCRRFGEVCGVPAIDTDIFMTPEEVVAVQEGRYTQAMRLANIERYAAEVCRLLTDGAKAVAIADGLPNDEARAFLQESLPDASVVFVLVKTPRVLWEARLSDRGDSAVQIGIIEADAYTRENWKAPSAGFKHEVIENCEDLTALDSTLRGLHRRFASTDP
jgi:broad-specificity NMP kinase